MARPITTNLTELFDQLFPNHQGDRPMSGEGLWTFVQQQVRQAPPGNPSQGCNHERELALALQARPNTSWQNCLTLVAALMTARNGYTGSAHTGPTQSNCGHQEQLASRLAQETTTPWDTLLDIIRAMLRTQENQGPAARTPTVGGTNLTQMVSAPKVPEFGDNTPYDAYRTQYRLYVRSIAPTTPLEILAGITGIMMGWKGRKLTFISNIEPETFLRPTALTATWPASTEQLLQFAKEKFQPVLDETAKRFQWENAINDMHSKAWRTVEDFFLEFETHLIKIRDAGIQPTEAEITRKFVACLPSSVEQYVRPNAPELDTAQYDTYRNLIALNWFHYKQNRAKTYLGKRTREENPEEVGTLLTRGKRPYFIPKCAIKTTPHVPEEFVGPISYKPEGTRRQNEEYRQRRERCIRARRCAKCRQTRQEHAEPDQYALPKPWQETTARTLEVQTQEPCATPEEFMDSLETQDA